ncbi:hypothetical protein BXZ70DRAFT_904752 [Cristinia sonorae]|uniref:Uncharacterized protein n=1 Tax=Cristinia sonorae TaxID=1940300 RepID=A0A8K0XSS7_9AGAR|nr:hypothetical protein BXZ70DRAFT_904752 [Cristinia sonorae]
MSSPVFDKTFSEYLEIPSLKEYGPAYEWYPTHDNSLGFYSQELSFYSSESPLTSSLSEFSPTQSDFDHDSSDVHSASGSDSRSEPEQEDLKPFIGHDEHSVSPHLANDTPYMPPSALESSEPSSHSSTTPTQHQNDGQSSSDDITSAQRASRQKANANLAILYDGDSDLDADGESDDGGDEYIPSPRIQPRDRRTFKYAYASPRSQSPTSSTSSSEPRFGYPDLSKEAIFRRTKPRHEQSSAPIDVDRMLGTSGRWRCPHPHCHYVQKNRRMPDFKRHLQTHTRFLEPEKWICCGVPIPQADSTTIATSAVTPFAGEDMVGGCWKVFSRRDALKRHLDNKNIPCLGNLNGPWMPGNRPPPL